MLVYFFKARVLSEASALVSLQHVLIVADVAGALADVLIGVSLCMLFHTARSGIKKANPVINTLMVLSLNTGLLTGLCSAGSLISLLVAPNTFIYAALFFNLGRSAFRASANYSS
ncbi:hypothetical protein HWV62_31409 [Athelia sp. TMB]|nr:hypothetical protein HWV62_31409 [Athelia sp. TMB]